VNRRQFLLASAAAALEPEKPEIPDDLIAEAYGKAARQNVLAAVNDKVFYGYFSVCADGRGFGYGYTYPSLDGHQLSDALLWLGRTGVVKANWDYVRKFQKPNGLLPIAILPGRKEVMGAPVEANGGFYTHWAKGNPLRALGSTTYLHNADVIFRRTGDRQWLREQIGSVNLALEYLAGLTTPEGRVGGAGYYIERPPRIEWDGVTQCYALNAFARAAALNRVAGETAAAARWSRLSSLITANFRREFWTGGRTVEYINPQHGRISNHGLTDVDWAALATGALRPGQRQALWPRVRREKEYYFGGMPTAIATEPERYQAWEFNKDHHDLAAMGRVWYLESWARANFRDGDGIMESLRRVATAGKRNGWYWRERYPPGAEGTFAGSGPNTYCEYPANLIRIVNRFVMGVEFGLDGVLTIAPVAPETFFREGFGQTVQWRNARLAFRIHSKGISGTYSGPRAQRIRARIGEKWVTRELAGGSTVSFEIRG